MLHCAIVCAWNNIVYERKFSAAYLFQAGKGFAHSSFALISALLTRKGTATQGTRCSHDTAAANSPHRTLCCLMPNTSPGSVSLIIVRRLRMRMICDIRRPHYLSPNSGARQNVPKRSGTGLSISLELTSRLCSGIARKKNEFYI